MLAFGCELVVVKGKDDRGEFEGRSQRMVFIGHGPDHSVDAPDFPPHRDEKEVELVRTRNYQAGRDAFPLRELPPGGNRRGGAADARTDALRSLRPG